MSIELKQAAQQALDALVKSKNALEVLWVSHHANRTDYAIEDIESAIEALRTAIQQAAEAKTDVRCEGCGYMTHHREHMGCVRAAKQFTHPAPVVPDFSRIAKRKLTELQEQGFAITGYAIQCDTVRGFIDVGGFVGWWQGEPAPGVPDGYVLVPIEPTQEMLQAMQSSGWLPGCYADMLTAAQAQKGQP